MKLKLKIGTAFCYAEEFEINGIIADTYDFGEKYDHDSENADDYCCENMKFDPILPTQEILDKYKITVNEYNKIASQLEEGLSFGSCGWCS